MFLCNYPVWCTISLMHILQDLSAMGPTKTFWVGWHMKEIQCERHSWIYCYPFNSDYLWITLSSSLHKWVLFLSPCRRKNIRTFYVNCRTANKFLDSTHVWEFYIFECEYFSLPLSLGAYITSKVWKPWMGPTKHS